MDHASCFSTKILSIGKTVNPFFDTDYKSWEDCVLKLEVEITLMHL
jgi:hypothetical protein